MSVGNKFQTAGAMTETARRASSVCVYGTDICGAAADLKDHAGVTVWII